MNEYYVYVYYDKELPIYVGKGKGNRFKAHLHICKNKKPGGHPFYDKLNKMLMNNNMPVIKIIENGLSNKDALKLERRIELEIGTKREGTGSLLNLNECGKINPILRGEDNAMSGSSVFEKWDLKYDKEAADLLKKEYRNKMSNSIKGKKHKRSTKDKMSNKRLDWHLNKSESVENERRDKISKSWDDDRRHKQSKIIAELNSKRSGSKNHRSRKCLVDGVLFESIKEVQLKYGFKNHNTVRHRINSDNFPDWNYADI